MRTTLTYSGVYDSDYSLVGPIAFDLARIQRITKSAIPGFIISSAVFDLVKQNLEGDPKEFLSSMIFPDNILEELKDSYFSLGISDDLTKQKTPIVNLILSPTYSEDLRFDGLILNVYGFEDFLDAIKTLYLRFLSEKRDSYRQNNAAKASCAIVVQKYKKTDSCVEAYASSEGIELKSYFGLVDITRSLAKDKTFMDLNLKIQRSDVASQEFKIVPGDQSLSLQKIYLKSKGYEKKVEDRLLQELGRLCKRVVTGFSCDIKAVFLISSGSPSFFLAHSYPRIDVALEEVEVSSVDSESINSVEQSSLYFSEVQETGVEISGGFENLAEGSSGDVDAVLTEYENNSATVNIENDIIENNGVFESQDNEYDLEDEELVLEIKNEVDANDTVFNEETVQDSFESFEDISFDEEHQDVGVVKIGEDDNNVRGEVIVDEITGFEDSKSIGEEIMSEDDSEEDDFLFSNDIQVFDDKEDEDFILNQTKTVNEEIDSSEDSFDYESVEDDEKKEDDNYSAQEDLWPLFEEKMVSMYKDSFGFEPINIRSAIIELDSKHGFDGFDDLLEYVSLKNVGKDTAHLHKIVGGFIEDG